MSDCTEHDWVKRARQGDGQAVAELYARYWRAARATAYGVTADLSSAEDAASEAFVQALQGLGDLQDPKRFGPWLRTIVIRSARRMKAPRAHDKGGPPQAGLEVPLPPVGGEMEQRELAILLREAVGRLPVRLREAISLFYFEKYDLNGAASFLGIPAGTLKRRLHEGRNRLREAALAISEGRKPMDSNRERAIHRLKELVEKQADLEDDAVFAATAEAMRLRPFPRELAEEFRTLWRRQLDKRMKADPARLQQIEAEIPRLARWLSPSPRAFDVSDPVGRAAQSIWDALLSFQRWQPDPAKTLQALLHGESSSRLPPGFAEGVPGSYVCAGRAWLLQGDDGSVQTSAEAMLGVTSREDLKSRVRTARNRLSDSLQLWQLRDGQTDLHAIEDLARGLASALLPGIAVRFMAYEEPRYRAALRMQLGDIPIPAAIGGVLESLHGIPDHVNVACVTLYLEAWATAQSGKAIELVDWEPKAPDTTTPPPGSRR